MLLCRDIVICLTVICSPFGFGLLYIDDKKHSVVQTPVTKAQICVFAIYGTKAWHTAQYMIADSCNKYLIAYLLFLWERCVIMARAQFVALP